MEEIKTIRIMPEVCVEWSSPSVRNIWITVAWLAWSYTFKIKGQ